MADMYPYYETDWSILPAEGNRRCVDNSLVIKLF